MLHDEFWVLLTASDQEACQIVDLKLDYLRIVPLYMEQGLCREYTSYFGKRASLAQVTYSVFISINKSQPSVLTSAF